MPIFVSLKYRYVLDNGKLQSVFTPYLADASGKRCFLELF